MRVRVRSAGSNANSIPERIEMAAVKAMTVELMPISSRRGDHQAHTQVGQEHAQRAPDEAQQDALGQNEPDQTARTRAQRDTYGRIDGSRLCPLLKKARDVHAPDQQNETHRPQKDQQRPSRVADDLLLQRPYDRLARQNAGKPVRTVSDLAETGDEAFGLQRCRFDRLSGCQPGNGKDVVSTEILGRRIELVGHPDIGVR